NRYGSIACRQGSALRRTISDGDIAKAQAAWTYTQLAGSYSNPTQAYGNGRIRGVGSNRQRTAAASGGRGCERYVEREILTWIERHWRGYSPKTETPPPWGGLGKKPGRAPRSP